MVGDAGRGGREDCRGGDAGRRRATRRDARPDRTCAVALATVARAGGAGGEGARAGAAMRAARSGPGRSHVTRPTLSHPPTHTPPPSRTPGNLCPETTSPRTLQERAYLLACLLARQGGTTGPSSLCALLDEPNGCENYKSQQSVRLAKRAQRVGSGPMQKFILGLPSLAMVERRRRGRVWCSWVVTSSDEA